MQTAFVAFPVMVSISICAFQASVRDLTSPTQPRRGAALSTLMAKRMELETELNKQLALSLANPDRSYKGETQTVLVAIARLQATNTVPELVKGINFTLDPDTFPNGDKRHNITYYPVAKTLATLGDRSVTKHILSAANAPRDDLSLQLYAWVLMEVVGKKGAIAMVEDATIGKAPRAIENLGRFKAAIEKPRNRLPLPGFKDRRLKGGA